MTCIITLAFKHSMICKYRFSNAKNHNLAAKPFLHWKGIPVSRRIAATDFDRRRSDCDNSGLIAFKDRGAASRSALTHWRYAAHKTEAASNGWILGLARYAFAHLSDRLLMTTGKILYRHIGERAVRGEGSWLLLLGDRFNERILPCIAHISRFPVRAGIQLPHPAETDRDMTRRLRSWF